MKKSLNNKRNELSEEHIADLTRLYGNFTDGEKARVCTDERAGVWEERIVSRIFENHEFGFLKVTVERPLRLNFEATAERIARLDDQSAFAALAVSRKRKDAKAVEAEEAEGRAFQEAIRAMLQTLAGGGLVKDRDAFEPLLEAAAIRAKLKLPAAIKKAIFAALGERDPTAEICRDGKGRPEPDTELRDTENIPLPTYLALPHAFAEKIAKVENMAHRGAKLPMFFGPDMPNDDLVAAMKPTIDAYMAAEVLPNVDDAWVDYAKTKISYQIPIDRVFYRPRVHHAPITISVQIKEMHEKVRHLIEGALL